MSETHIFGLGSLPLTATWRLGSQHCWQSCPEQACEAMGRRAFVRYMVFRTGNEKSGKKFAPQLTVIRSISSRYVCTQGANNLTYNAIGRQRQKSCILAYTPRHYISLQTILRENQNRGWYLLPQIMVRGSAERPNIRRMLPRGQEG